MGFEDAEIVLLPGFDVVSEAQDLFDFGFCGDEGFTVGGLNEDIVDVFLVDEAAQKGLERDKDLIVLIHIRRINALFLHNPDHPAGHPPDEDAFPQGVFAAKELFRDLLADDRDAAQLLVILVADEGAFFGEEVPHFRIVGRSAGDQNG